MLRVIKKKKNAEKEKSEKNKEKTEEEEEEEAWEQLDSRGFVLVMSLLIRTAEAEQAHG